MFAHRGMVTGTTESHCPLADWGAPLGPARVREDGDASASGFFLCWKSATTTTLMPGSCNPAFSMSATLVAGTVRKCLRAGSGEEVVLWGSRLRGVGCACVQAGVPGPSDSACGSERQLLQWQVCIRMAGPSFRLVGDAPHPLRSFHGDA